MSDALSVLRWALEAFAREKLVLASSFGPEDVVIIDLLHEIGRFPRIVTLETGRLHPETHALIDELRRRYGLPVEFYCPDASELEALLREHGPNPFYESVELRRRCCDVRKIAPLRRALRGCAGWITGLRRAQSASRAQAAAVEWDEQFELLKVNPLASWSAEDVWARIKERGVPYNRLHDQGFPSIGCSPCTRPVKPGEDERSGRWWWEQGSGKECGLHRPASSVSPPAEA